MSIARIENQEEETVLKKDGGLSAINVKNIALKAAKSFSGKPLEIILVFSFITTALGELFGRKYSGDWYIMLFTILIIFTIKEIVCPKLQFNKEINKKL